MMMEPNHHDILPSTASLQFNPITMNRLHNEGSIIMRDQIDNKENIFITFSIIY